MKSKITINGLALIFSALENEKKIIFTKMQIGNGKTSNENITTLTSLNNAVMDIAISKKEKVEDCLLLTSKVISNSEISEPLTWNELGVFAKTEDEDEILFAIVYSDEDIEILFDKSSGLPIESKIEVAINLSQNINTDVVIRYGEYCFKEDLDKHLNDNNPHKITSKDLGLDRVENVSINDAQTVIEEQNELDYITENDKAKARWGKVKKAIQELISHLSNENNPHKISPETISAAKKIHMHNANEINNGELPIERGGTGANNAHDAINNLISKCQHLILNNSVAIFAKTKDTLNKLRLIADDANDWILIGSSEANAISMQAKTNQLVFNGTDLKSLYPLGSGTSLGTSTYYYNGAYTNGYYTVSDLKAKENIVDTDIGYEVLKNLKFHQFNRIGQNKKEFGLIAQEVFEVFQRLGIYNSNAYSVMLDGKTKLTSDEEIKKYPDERLSWTLNYLVINNYIAAGLQKLLFSKEDK